MTNITKCGMNCNFCKQKLENKCAGCKSNDDVPCELYLCAISQNIFQCSKCVNYPCEKVVKVHRGEKNKDVNFKEELSDNFEM